MHRPPGEIDHAFEGLVPAAAGANVARLQVAAETASETHTESYLRHIGVRDIAPATCPFDPGYDPVTVESHLQQSAHLMSALKISMACWMVADEGATRAKVAAARAQGVATVAGGGPFEVAAAQNGVSAYFDLCAEIGISRVECGEGLAALKDSPATLVAMARERGLEVHFELGEKHSGAFSATDVDRLVAQGKAWLDAGALRLVIEARESAVEIGVFDGEGKLDAAAAERFADVLGLENLVFEAPDKRSQFAFVDHFGPEVQLGNVRLEELLRVEIYRRGLHADAFLRSELCPVPNGR